MMGSLLGQYRGLRITVQGASPEEMRKQTDRQYLRLELAFNINLNKKWPDIILLKVRGPLPSPQQFHLIHTESAACLHGALEGNREQEARNRGLSWIKNLGDIPQSKIKLEVFPSQGYVLGAVLPNKETAHLELETKGRTLLISLHGFHLRTHR